MRLPGERLTLWTPEAGQYGIAVIEVDPEFVDDFVATANEQGIEVTLHTSAGAITGTGKFRRGVLTDLLRAYILTARRRSLS